MLNSIELFNFESHKHSLIEFDSNFHVITGESDCGKSGIRRALFWIMLNKGKKKSIRSWWCEDKDETKVIAKIDGHTVTRLITKTRNEYQLDDEVYKAFGTNVPEDIAKLFNINEINTGNQFEGHFLLSKPAGAVAKFFNKIIGLDAIDTTLAEIKSIKSDKKSTIKVLDRELKENEFIIEEYGNYAIINKRIRVIKKVEASIDILRKDLGALNVMQDSINTSNNFIDSNKTSFIKVNKLLRKFEKVQRQEDLLIVDITFMVQESLELAQIQTKLRVASDRPPILKKITDVKFALDELNICMEDLEKMDDKFIELNKTYQASNEITINYRENKANFDIHMKGVCPLCEK